MSCFSKFRELFQNLLHGKQDQPQSATTATHNPTSEDPAQEDPYDALSEISAPPPVERFQHDDANAVDSGSDISIGEDPYRALSEVSVEPPVKLIHESADTLEKHLRD
ncbi:hypothetical protein EIK77_009241 [Talaromyces pinophilus]|nr:hypothetical protein EIK77_009241 [Talaromyces pinophilus]KUL81508.1 hypothetical protein ZTR_11380 [Talaromyces verruculosus]